MPTLDHTKIRNVAIIAHVDHGKTTLVDGLLKQSNTFRDNQAEMSQDLIMDSGDQERERGITITAKITAVEHNGYHINIIDTPGHADFGGEVERTLNMADGCLLIVDAQEGPMPQTKFVLTKALALNLKPIVVINKIDKPGSRVHEVEDELADLFLELAVHEDQLHYPIYYAIGREGKAWKEMPTDAAADADLSKGREAEFSTSRQIGDRLQKELETNIGLLVEQDGIGFLVSGRGELHLSVLIETMRREGFEFEVGRPQVVTHEEAGKTMEPLEEVIVEATAEHVGTIQAEFGQRRANLKEQFTTNKGVTKLI